MNWTINSNEYFELCKAECLKQAKDFYYEFVWLFILGFMLTEMSFIVYKSKKIAPRYRLGLSRGLRLSGYLFNLIAILYFLFIVR